VGDALRIEGAPAGPEQADPSAHPLIVHTRRFATGLAVLFVPFSVLQKLSIVSVEGGRGLLILTDLDTLFLDAMAIASVTLVWTRWSAARNHVPYMSYLVLLSGLTAGLMAYVVTNFGTLFRLRMMIFLPIWLLVLATARADVESHASHVPVPGSPP
jgi:hypothetical protein